MRKILMKMRKMCMGISAEIEYNIFIVYFIARKTFLREEESICPLSTPDSTFA